LIPQLAEPQTKELTMNDPRNAWRRRIGGMMLAALLAGAALAQSSDAPPMGFENGPDMPPGDFPPPFPPEGAKNREQGVVLLKVLVNADGSARKVEADPDNKASPELTKAASDAALTWHYSKQDAKSADAWLKVPVRFSLSLLPPHPPGPAHGVEMPPPPPPGAPPASSSNS
jgi:TonB family protein